MAYTYDAVGRVKKKVVTNGSGTLTSNYTFIAGHSSYGTGATTPLIAGISQGGVSFAYEYDAMGNITKETRTVGSTSQVTTYVYDGMNQLTRVNCPYDTTAGSTGTTWVYEYDRGGNMQSANAYAYTTGTVGTVVNAQTFQYNDNNWKDKLTVFNNKYYRHDGLGNVLYDGYRTYTWAEGRNLKQIVMNDGRTIKFYDHEGTRYRRDVISADGATTTSLYYIFHGKKLMNLSFMHFFYDADGKPSHLKYGGNYYNYVLNVQGDVVGLTNASGTLVVEYKYDAWGKLLGISGSLASSVGMDNPLRYRGYVYDTETGLYYLHSRYYNPETRRFVSADDIVYLSYNGNFLDNNLYAYCTNNSINYCDHEGTYKVYFPFSDVMSWAGSMWWLAAVDGVLPIGDLVYGAGFVLLGVIALAAAQDEDESKKEVKSVKEKKGNERLYGDPGDINIDGYRETHIGSDGRADKERHHTDHGKAKVHTNPHDHEIKWNGNKPSFGKYINYPSGKVPLLK